MHVLFISMGQKSLSKFVKTFLSVFSMFLTSHGDSLKKLGSDNKACIKYAHVYKAYQTNSKERLPMFFGHSLIKPNL